MVHALLDAVRDRLTPRNVLFAGAVFGFLHFAFDTSPAQLATTVAMSLLVGLADVVDEVYDLRESVKHLATGLPAVVGGASLLAFDEGPLWLPVAFVAIGGWFVLDAVQTARHEGITEDTPSGREVYHDYVGRRIHELLEERPRTRRELSDALEADDDAIDAAIEKLRSRDVITRVGSEFRPADPDERGRLAKTRSWVGRLGRRIARPVAIEFEREGSASDVRGDPGDSGVSGDPGGSGGSDGSVAKGAQSHADGDRPVETDERTRPASADRDRERETESTGGD